MEKKKFQSVSIAAIIVSILPLAALAPSLLHLSLSDGVRSIKDTSSRPAKDLE